MFRTIHGKKGGQENICHTKVQVRMREGERVRERVSKRERESEKPAS